MLRHHLSPTTLQPRRIPKHMAVRVQETYRSVDSRMAQESLRRYVLRVLRVWRSWFIFSDDFLNGLQVRERVRSAISWSSSAGCVAVSQV